MKILVANRGEVAVRVVRAAAGIGASTVAVYTCEDADSLHVQLADESSPLPGSGVAGYLDGDAMVAAAMRAGCTHVHPGWGFLSEDAQFAVLCRDAGLVFVGPSPEVLALFGDKSRARARAVSVEVPVLDAVPAPVSLEQARAFLAENPGGIMVKAVAGGGGRGMRQVVDPAQLDEAFARSRSEARLAFGHDELYVERLMRAAKHIEIQVVGDGSGTVVHLGERECSVQRRHQKLIEVAPSPSLNDDQRASLGALAVRLTESVNYSSLGTVEFLVDADALKDGKLSAAFIELNPRLQVEHTVTEEVTGVDLVAAQLRIAAGATLTELGLLQVDVPAPTGFAIQSRLNADRRATDGETYAATGTLSRFEPPGGPGVRVDTHAQAGLILDGTFDSLLAKIITHTRHGGFPAAAAHADRALAELHVEGVETNAAVLQAVLTHPAFVSGEVTTSFMTEIAGELPVNASTNPLSEKGGDAGGVHVVLGGTVVAVPVTVGDTVTAKTPVVIVESMKMEHVVTAGAAGVITKVLVAPGDQVHESQAVIYLDASLDSVDSGHEVEEIDPDHVRPDLAHLLDLQAAKLDDARPQVVQRRHQTGHRTIRENLAELVDPGSFREYGGLTVAAQRRRRSVGELAAATPADGIVLGLATVNSNGVPDFGQCVVMGYDYTVLAGTQGFFGHRKTDRMLALAEQQALPVILFAEGGGGRPGDVDVDDIASSMLDCGTFAALGRLSGQVPLVGVLTGRCFAGNAALLGSCDVVIATKDSSLGMAGPAMIEGGGLGRFAPEEVGPMSVQVPNGVVDVLVEDDAEAVEVAKRYLNYFQGPHEKHTHADQRVLRHLVPENRMRVYDVREVIDALADTDSVLELRRGFGHGVITALVRIDGRPLGLVANNPGHLGGAIDADAADKLARFLQLCDAHGLPVVSLCDTPGFMVGPESERDATVRHFSRLFVIGAHLSVPIIAIILRKGYGLGAQAMAAGGFRETLATIAWPTGEVGGMGLEGAVQLGYSQELAAISDRDERQRRYDELVAEQYESGKAINAARVFELDDVIDPADTRGAITGALAAWRGPDAGRRRRSYIDTW
ncbi:acetyl/propionyl-CoA carboxylase alpha subunit [Rhodococcus percolatus]|uniref:acetyl-CoA carboxylase family protein n=1 Tax=Rhodococcus opacus TaxID=37919 RepID=UPI0015FDC536|nr:carboxyl transferase domain-containing protein [Rhodococcus opacus]MBA8964491.1 acetyl/propionyl-CoA carboxylase alpha subunit [Rhodococcus opacus]MBP2207546.1 acetyl/propionyl-CoA carboxylase alpha subunit [Rhodococcus opacus]